MLSVLYLSQEEDLPTYCIWRLTSVTLSVVVGLVYITTILPPLLYSRHLIFLLLPVFTFSPGFIAGLYRPR